MNNLGLQIEEQQIKCYSSPTVNNIDKNSFGFYSKNDFIKIVDKVFDKDSTFSDILKREIDKL